MYETVITGKFLLNGSVFEGSVGIEGGRIKEISRRELKGERLIRLKRETIALPGLIDVHVHLRDFNEKHKETFESGTKAAIHGGITTVFDMPNTKPPVNSVETLEKRSKEIRGRAYSDYALGFLVGENCQEAKETKADFYKIFMGSSTGGFYSRNFEEDLRCSPGVTSVHAEAQEIILKDPKRPPEAEERGIERALKAAETLRKPLNICHVSTGKGIEMILKKKLPWVSFEVTPHHLFLTRRDYERDPLLKVYPPLRDENYRRTLWRHFSEIPIIASDHAPHTIEDKEAGAAGIPGLETEVSLLLDAVNRGIITLSEIVDKMHTNPIKIFGIRNKGFQVGKDADFTVVNLKLEWKVRPEEFYTKAKWSPWEGKKLKGKVVMTILRGEVVMENDEVYGKPSGRRISTTGND